MSSEDDADEVINRDNQKLIVTVRIIRKCGWRADLVRKYVDWIDLARKEDLKIPTKGAPRIRVDEFGPGTPPKGLPRSLYDESYLDQERRFDNDIERTLKINKKDFELLNVVASQLRIGEKVDKGKGKATDDDDDDMHDIR
ncbi:hypothetical protein R3P38DRAFT_3201364 [Favolaschia claudopus]|uniref:Uncharacterized protein n=1 Tax=Favolaschia claudopus TaxID=2862362 RepID=A0AAW0AWA3_9AGAR